MVVLVHNDHNILYCYCQSILITDTVLCDIWADLCSWFGQPLPHTSHTEGDALASL